MNLGYFLILWSLIPNPDSIWIWTVNFGVILCIRTHWNLQSHSLLAMFINKTPLYSLLKVLVLLSIGICGSDFSWLWIMIAPGVFARDKWSSKTESTSSHDKVFCSAFVFSFIFIFSIFEPGANYFVLVLCGSIQQ